MLKNIKPEKEKLLRLLGMAVLFYTITYIALLVIRFISPETMVSYDSMLSNAGYESDSSVLPWILTLIVAPLMEEICFRGVILWIFMRFVPIPFWAANLIQAALFGIFHMNPVQSVYAFLFGLLLGLLFKKEKTSGIPSAVFYCIFFHFCVNMCNVPVVLVTSLFVS